MWLVIVMFAIVVIAIIGPMVLGVLGVDDDDENGIGPGGPY